MRLFRSIFNYGIALCQRCCQHNINRCTHGYHIKEDMRSCQSLSFRNNHAIFYLYICTQHGKSLNVLVDRPASNIAAARQCYFCLIKSAKQCPQQIIRCSDLFNIFVIRMNGHNRTSINLYTMSVYSVYSRTDTFNRINQDVDILYIRKIIYGNCFICHNRCSQYTQCCVLCSAYFYLSCQRSSTFYNVFIHYTPLYKFYTDGNTLSAIYMLS